MKPIRKLTAIQPVSILPETREILKDYCEDVIFYDTEPETAQEIIERIQDSDAIFVSYTKPVGREILSACPNLRYIGMCCSLYSESSSNVDIAYAREHGMIVTGIRDYGDEGVAEYVISELISRLHGSDGEEPLLGVVSELSGVHVGMLGMGASAQAVAKCLSAFGAEVSYFSRTRKRDIELERGYRYLELPELLQNCDVICSCLSKNVTLLYETELETLGDEKILFNTALSPCFDQKALEHWLEKGHTWYYCDTLMGLGDESLLAHPHVKCQKRSSGMTIQAVQRLNEKVLENLISYCQSLNEE